MPRAAGASIIITIMTMTTAMLTEGGLYRLLAWLSPSFPVGAFSYSHGIEAAVEAGRIADRASLEAWVGAILRHGTARIDADLFRDAWRAVSSLPLPLREREGPIAEQWEGEGVGAARENPSPSRCAGPSLSRKGRGDVDLAILMLIAARADAYRDTAETALESRAQGEAFLATCRAAWPHPMLDAWHAALAAEQRAPSYAVAVAVATA